MELSFLVDAACSGKPVKYILKNKLGLSERLVKKLKYAGKVSCNERPVYVNHIVSSGDLVAVSLSLEEESEGIIPENIPVEILYEDESLIILNKQPHMPIHPSSSHPSGTLANGLMYYYANKGEKNRIRPVSRLDRDTTGAVVFAKNPFIQQQLVKQMESHSFAKEYIGVVWGNVTQSSGTIDLPIERKPGSIMLRQTSVSGTPAVTHFEVLERFSEASLLKFRLETGRTHQIRVHCQAVGHPLIGDTLYGREGDNSSEALIDRQALHSHRLSFFHPMKRTPLELFAPTPADIARLLEILRK